MWWAFGSMPCGMWEEEHVRVFLCYFGWSWQFEVGFLVRVSMDEMQPNMWLC